MTAQNPRDMRDYMRTLERLSKQQQAVPAMIANTVKEVEEKEQETKARRPAPPIELEAQTGFYLDPIINRHRVRLSMDFPDVIFNTDGTKALIKQYELWGREETESTEEDDLLPEDERPWDQQATNTESFFRVGGYVPGRTWRFRARALGINSIQPGEWSDEFVITMARDTTPPPQPSAPTAEATRGQIIVTWDGKAVSGDMPADFSYTILAHGTESSPTKEVARFGPEGGFTVISGAAYNKPQHFRLRAVDESGNLGPWSEQVTAITTPLVDVDIILSEIDAAKTQIKNASKIIIESGVELGQKLKDNDEQIAETEKKLTGPGGLTERLAGAETKLADVGSLTYAAGQTLRQKLAAADAATTAAAATANTLKNTTIPKLNTDLTAATGRLTTAEGQITTAQTDLTTAKADIVAAKKSITDNKTVMDGAVARLTITEADVTAAKARLTTAEGKLTTLQNTTLPALNKDLSDAEKRIDSAQGLLDLIPGNISDAKQAAIDAAMADAEAKVTASLEAARLDAQAKATAAQKAATEAAAADATKKTTDAQAAAALDAKTKADKALSDAKTDATNKAAAAQKAAIEAAAADATEKAEAAEAAAATEAARLAKDASDVAEAAALKAAKAYADAQADGAGGLALEAAKADATEKANAAKTAAITAAALDATAKKEEAERVAAADAKTKADKALSDAKIDASDKATAAQKAATEAAAADAASKTAAALATAATDAKNKADKALSDAKSDATTKADKALSDAKTDATNKANAAKADAIAAADLAAKADATAKVAAAELRAANDAKTKADKALSDAKSDATTKANAAEKAAIEAAAADAAEQAEAAEARAAKTAAEAAKVLADQAQAAALEAAKLYADAQADGAGGLALEAAKADATEKANAAKTAAITAAALDATAKKEEAERVAAADAKTKADKALSDAKTDATTKANAAEKAATAAAAADAASKTAAALVTAANDAKTKADKALSDAKTDATNKANAAQKAAIDAAAVTTNAVREEALAAARAAAGLANTMGRTWFQPEAPTSGATYEWAGAPYKSESIRKVDGADTFRNFATHGTFKEGAAQLISSVGNGKAAEVTFVDDPALPGEKVLRIVAGGNGYALAGLTVNSPSLIANREKSLRFLAKIWSNTIARPLSFTLREPNNIKQEKPTQADRWETIDRTYAVPALAVTSQVGQEAGHRAVGDELRVASVMIVDPAYTGDYFDGDTPDDREFDLWIDTDDGNTPKRWDRATKTWSAVTDQKAIDAAIAAAAADATTKADAALANAKEDATTKAEAARKAAVETAANDAKTKADAAEKAAIASAALEAQKKVDAAATATLTAAATEAQKKADKAKQDAVTAAAAETLLKANGAREDAIAAAGLDAKTKADTAQRLATEAAALHADQVAQQAKTDAITAAANDATSKANKAKADALDAAALDASFKADEAERRAKADAATAQARADKAVSDAAAASGLAAGKGKTLIQSTAPGAEDRNKMTLWIDTTGGNNTPKMWTTGTTWVAVTDKKATDAASAAAAAKSAAEAAAAAAATAQSQADSAMSAAGSLNQVYYSTKDPSGIAPAGSTWRKQDSAKNIIGEWQYVGGTTPWQAQLVTSQAISNLDLGKLSVGTAAMETAVVKKLVAETASFQTVDAKNIFVTGTASLSEVVARRLAAETGTFIQLTTDQLTAGSANINNLVAQKIATATASIQKADISNLTAGSANMTQAVIDKLVANTAKFQTVTVDNITATATANLNNVVAQRIAAGTASFQTVDAKNLFVTGTSSLSDVVARRLAAETGTFIQLSVDQLTVSGNANLTTAVADKLFTNIFSTNKLTTNELLVGQGENLIPWAVNAPDGSRTASPHISLNGAGALQIDGAGTGLAGGNHLVVRNDTVKPGTFMQVVQLRPATKSPQQNVGVFEVLPSTKYKLSVWIKAGGTYTTYPDVRLSVGMYDTTGAYVNGPWYSETKKISWDWVQHTYEFTTNANHAGAIIHVTMNQPGTVRIDQPSFTKDAASLIATGGIIADHIQASEAMSAKVGQFLKLEVGNLVATGSANLNTAVVEKLWTDVVRSRSITTDMLLVGKGTNLIPNGDLANGLSGWNDKYGIYNADPAAVRLGYPASIWVLGNNTISSNARFSLKGGQTYQFSMYARANTAGKRFFVQLMTAEADASNPYLVSNEITYTGSFREYGGEFVAPEGATSAYMRVFANHTNGTTTEGHQWFTGFELYEKNGASLIVDGGIVTKQLKVTEDMTVALLKAHKVKAGEIDVNSLAADTVFTGLLDAKLVVSDMFSGKLFSGGTFTGSIFRTHTAANTGVQLDSVGLRAWNTGKTQTFTMSASTGDVSIAGGTFTGGLFQTVSAAKRGLKLNTDGLFAYNSKGGLTFVLDGAEGDAQFDSRVTFGSYTTPHWVIVPWRGSDTEANARAGVWMVQGNSNGIGGTETGGMFIDAATSKSANALNLRGTNNGGVKTWGNLEASTVESGTISHNGGNYKIQGANGSFFNAQILFHGQVIMDGLSATSQSANLMTDANGRVWRSSSASRYKLDQKVSSLPDSLLDLNFKDWVDKGQVDEYAAIASGPRPLTEAATHTLQNSYLGRVGGVVAEDVEAAAGSAAQLFVTYDHQGRLETVAYDRLGVALALKLAEKVDKLAAELAALKGAN